MSPLWTMASSGSDTSVRILNSMLKMATKRKKVEITSIIIKRENPERISISTRS